MEKKVGRFEEKMKDLEEKGKAKKSQKFAEILDDMRRDRSVKARLNLEAGGAHALRSSERRATVGSEGAVVVNAGGDAVATLDVNRLLGELRERERDIELLREKYMA